MTEQIHVASSGRVCAQEQLQLAWGRRNKDAGWAKWSTRLHDIMRASRGYPRWIFARGTGSNSHERLGPALIRNSTRLRYGYEVGQLLKWNPRMWRLTLSYWQNRQYWKDFRKSLYGTALSPAAHGQPWMRNTATRFTVAGGRPKFRTCVTAHRKSTRHLVTVQLATAFGQLGEVSSMLVTSADRLRRITWRYSPASCDPPINRPRRKVEGGSTSCWLKLWCDTSLTVAILSRLEGAYQYKRLGGSQLAGLLTWRYCLNLARKEKDVCRAGAQWNSLHPRSAVCVRGAGSGQAEIW